MSDMLNAINDFFLSSNIAVALGLLIITMAYMATLLKVNHFALKSFIFSILYLSFSCFGSIFLKQNFDTETSFPLSMVLSFFIALLIYYATQINSAKNSLEEYKKILDEYGNLKADVEKLNALTGTLNSNIDNLKYSEKWHKKIKDVAINNNILHKNIWQKMALKYFHVQDRNINGNKFVISLDFYPQVTEELFNFYKHSSRAEFEIISTMLPQHYFEFPRYEKGQLVFKPVPFVSDYRDRMENLMNSKFQMKFNRYTLVLNDEEESRGVFSAIDFDKSKEMYSESKRSTYYDYFINKLHPTEDSVFIKQFEKNNLPKYTNFLRIKKDDYSVYIVANVSISKDICMIEIIDCNSNEQKYNKIKFAYEAIKEAKSI